MKIFITILFFNIIKSHSWLDCIGLADTEYTGHDQYFGEEDFKKACIGYPRAYPGREDKDIGTKYTTRITGRGPQERLCSKAQSKKAYTHKYNLVTAKAGTRLKLWWEANGHAAKKTSVTVFWTKRPNSQLVKYKDANAKSKLVTFDYATEENCQDVKKTNSLCWGFMEIPKGIKKGVYSFVWKWPFDQNPIGEDYTTCFDINVK